jgi:hypothetical protein
MPLAVYTTIYPGVEIYLRDWCDSLRRQTDQDFQLWIGLDTLERSAVQNVLGPDIVANWVIATSGSTPAAIRQQSLSRIIEVCTDVVLVDSDDLLHPTRIAAARRDLNSNELTGCALCIVDQAGKDLDTVFGLPSKQAVDDVFPRNNIYGFSNSAFRSDLLRRCLPIPPAAKLVDWFIATKAWLFGATLGFDSTPRMYYRQHSENTARVRFPFSPAQVLSDTALVRQHFEFILAEAESGFLASRKSLVDQVASDVEKFHREIVLHPYRLKEYVQALNRLQPAPVWWSCVANPALGHMWRGNNRI